MSLFCEKCGSIMRPKKGEPGKMQCGNCNHLSTSEAKLTEKVNKITKVEVVLKKENVLPKIQADCPKCAHKEAEYWTIQTRSADEPETKFLRCMKCEHTWRDYS